MNTHGDPELLWVRNYPRQALLSLMGLSRDAELAHRRLSDIICGGAPWPAAEPDKAGELARVPPDQWATVLAELKAVGWHTRNGRLVNPAVAALRDQARDACAGRRAISAAGNRARWRPAGHPDRTPDGNPDGTADGLPSGLQMKMKMKMEKKNEEAMKPDERLTLSGSTREQPRDGEREFLEELSGTLATFNPSAAQAELTNWGGWWRNRFRENPAKARRVLAELRSMIRERRIRRNPGAAAKDLWDRLP